MKLLVDIEKDYYEMIKYNVEHGQDYKPFEIIANGTPYEERPQGEWVVVYEENNIKTCKCSKCGRIEDIVDFDKYPFCHCGADMRKGGVE